MPRPLPDLLAHNPLPPAIDCDSQGDPGHQGLLSELLSGWTSPEHLVFKSALEMLLRSED